MAQAEIGIIGGSGLYSMPGLTNIEEVTVQTPFGEPSDAFVLGTLEGRKVAFLARHGEAPEDIAANAKAIAAAKASGGFTGMIFGTERVLPARMINPMLDSIVKARNGTGAPTAADSAALRAALLAAQRTAPPLEDEGRPVSSSSIRAASGARATAWSRAILPRWCAWFSVQAAARPSSGLRSRKEHGNA